jgi:hypothetical protein
LSSDARNPQERQRRKLEEMRRSSAQVPARIPAFAPDETMDLLLRNIRDRRLSSTVKAYTTASQACRREASP